MVKPALKAVLETEEIKLYPNRFNNTYRHWLENIRDWNISRQLWWGQQIPAFYYGEGKEKFVVAETKEKALVLAQQQSGNASLSIEDLRQDEDALDTWFSSWLWPMAVFGGILDPENKDFKYYYPTNDLVTGPDILFFWVARMIFAGYEYTGMKPFSNVYLTGLVRDKQRRKMSKSLGNSPDPLDLIDKYGADGVRVGLLLSASAGNDIMFDEELCSNGKAFSNKIWNAFKLVKGWEVSDEIKQPESSSIAIDWYEAKLENGDAILATINSELLQWDSKASHPWVSIVTIYYDGSQYNGMPSKEDYTFIDTIEDELNALLHPAQGDLNIGRETGQDQRQLFFASKDYRNISKALDHIVQQYQDKFEIELAIYKDKYWQSYAQYIRN
jgi:valyl-tRNA synthetase